MVKGRKPKKVPPPIVKFAMIVGDRDKLSRLGKAGAARKKEIAARDREIRERMMLACAAEMAEQANEDICPID